MSIRRPMNPLVVRELDNPGYDPAHDEALGNPRMAPVVIDTRESAVESLFARGRLDVHQKRVADIFRQRWEAYSRDNVQALNYERDTVSGGVGRLSASEAQITARRQLRIARIALGRRGYELVVEVCGKGRSLGEIVGVDRGSKDGGRDRARAADNLRDHLDDLCHLWGLWSTAPRRRRR